MVDVYGEPTLFYDSDADEMGLEDRVIHRVATERKVEEYIVRKPYLGTITISNFGYIYHFYADRTLEDEKRHFDMSEELAKARYDSMEVAASEDVVQ